MIVLKPWEVTRCFGSDRIRAGQRDVEEYALKNIIGSKEAVDKASGIAKTFEVLSGFRTHILRRGSSL